MAMKKRVGMYCWAGPGTIRMIQLKYPNQTINKDSLMASYNLDQLREAQNNLGVTDAWVSFSWGFSEQTEQADYQFIASKLKNFKKLGIKTHAYIQGPNLVYDEHQKTDYWCVDQHNRRIPYHRGRYMTCVNKPETQAYIRHKIEGALEYEFDGIYVDNFYFGLLPLITGNKVSFFGCRCQNCQQKFSQRFEGKQIPDSFELGSQLLQDYTRFRSDSLMSFASELASLVHASGREYGSNSFDLSLDTTFYFGTDIELLSQIQDYILVENHMLPRPNKNNSHLKPWIQKLNKPVFVVSYKKGIGQESTYSQSEFDAIFSESQELGYYPCYKASEFNQGNVAINLDFTQLKPVKQIELKINEWTLKPKQLPWSWLFPVYNWGYPWFLQNYYNNHWWRKAFNWVYYRAIQ